MSWVIMFHAEETCPGGVTHVWGTTPVNIPSNIKCYFFNIHLDTISFPFYEEGVASVGQLDPIY